MRSLPPEMQVLSCARPTNESTLLALPRPGPSARALILPCVRSVRVRLMRSGVLLLLLCRVPLRTSLMLQHYSRSGIAEGGSPSLLPVVLQLPLLLGGWLLWCGMGTHSR